MKTPVKPYKPRDSKEEKKKIPDTPVPKKIKTARKKTILTY
jgi:hypothetical protein